MVAHLRSSNDAGRVGCKRKLCRTVRATELEGIVAKRRKPASAPNFVDRRPQREAARRDADAIAEGSALEAPGAISRRELANGVSTRGRAPVRHNGPAPHRLGPRGGMVTQLACSNEAGRVRCRR